MERGAGLRRGRGGGRRGGAIFAAAVGWAASALQAHALDAPYLLQLSGMCDDKMALNSLFYEYQGTTADGAPYYKAQGQEEYMYYDRDCAASGDGNPRWILDSDRPSTELLKDLDNDEACDYHARFGSEDSSSPPHTGTWKVMCNGDWESRAVTLLVITTTVTSTSTQTSTTATTTVTTTTATSTTVSSTTTQTSTTQTFTSTNTSTTVSKTSTSTATVTSTTSTTEQVLPPAPRARLVLSGMCEFHGELNGVVFEEQGLTAAGSPWFQSVGSSEHVHYIYYDSDCNGMGMGGAPRWILDDSAPNASRFQDLDADESCKYHARVDSNDTQHPPASGEWQIFCGAAWEGHALELGPAHFYGAEDPKVFVVAGACEERGFLNGLIFKEQGKTANGAPWFAAENGDQTEYIYYDLDCNGKGFGTSARWIIDEHAPHPDRLMDVDEDGSCMYHARADSDDISAPPTSGEWQMLCGAAGWEGVNLDLTELIMEGGVDDEDDVEDDVDDEDSFNFTYSNYTQPEGFCHNSPEQICRMLCGSPPQCGADECVFRVGRCCDFECRPDTEEDHGETHHTTAPPHSGPHEAPLEEFHFAGACQAKSYLSAMTFVKQGETKTGAPFYKAESAITTEYVYFDPNCRGDSDPTRDPVARWIIDSDLPSLERNMDLDEDGECNYHARISTGDSATVPGEAVWRMLCGEEWEDVTLAIVPGAFVEEKKTEEGIVADAAPHRSAPATALLVAAAAAVTTAAAWGATA